mmetsp:Transcript_21737/g.53697  ORF Transcript_21737/g.53697 Transcript_21737/m.53697 type:complete len:527 (-) Transcript_21737:3061-4641(-)|eukprot:CAMPEP_0113637108 /NCGR_PEP_ID=MMETSP0017_2-20120614/19413_1 /TAXON_ID=2856 /ORGANISM="Cylindrotheca closterium" /LENGTH=526 /DNA_ID=CAMNT_0000548099 /DNA_START=29 /DNA_END=1609 /DNA_ORIENTATION=+ /assembly_acc=CAM_ASM_000147
MKKSILLYGIASWLTTQSHGFVSKPNLLSHINLDQLQSKTVLNAWGNEEKDDATIEEEARVKVWGSRRNQIRTTLKSAESLRNFRIKNGFIPELDEDGKPIKSDGKFALTATAFVVAAGAIALRVGGRAALISTIGLDFFTDNPELQGQMNQVLEVSDSMGLLERGGLFCLAWTFVKVFCFDAGGIVLALSAGILFGGVFEGAVASAFGATVGSSVAFAAAKLDTPVRKKALEIVEENPSLRGIEKVVAEDGLKAILTLRLAPIIPIPVGMYNYVYGVTNVPYFDFAGGIFLGSLKPYLLDSYLGFFGKTLVDGTAGDAGGFQDTLLLVALGFSVLIGVFASQLAGETWDSVLEEQKAEALAEGDDDDDGIVREVFGVTLPEALVNFQSAMQSADERVDKIILQEYDAQVWNYTDAKGDNPIPDELNPALAPYSPEVVGAYKGIKYGASICDGLALSPALSQYFFTFADPLFDPVEFDQERESKIMAAAIEVEKAELLDELERIRNKVVERVELIDRRLAAGSNKE